MTAGSAPAPTLGPTRLSLAADLSDVIGGAWLPYTDHISTELGGLQSAARERLGTITGIEVNWRNLGRYPGLDSAQGPETLPLMCITAERADVTVLVIPPRTASTLAAELLRQAGGRLWSSTSEHSHLYRGAHRILHRAAAHQRAAHPAPA
jgi:hypothetical protein